MNDEEREKAQNEFMQGEERYRGGDKRVRDGNRSVDIRFVAHSTCLEASRLIIRRRAAPDAMMKRRPASCFSITPIPACRNFLLTAAIRPLAFIVQTYEMLRREADEKHELQISIKEMASRLSSEGNDMMLSSALHVLDREGYIDRFDIPGRRVRGTRLLNRRCRARQLKLDTAKLRGKGAARSREAESRDRLRLRATMPATNDFALFWRGRPARCGNCDICLETAGPSRAPPTKKHSSCERR